MQTRRSGGAAEKGTVGMLLFTTDLKIGQDVLLAHEMLVENIQLKTFRQSRKNVAGNVYPRYSRVVEKN